MFFYLFKFNLIFFNLVSATSAEQFVKEEEMEIEETNIEENNALYNNLVSLPELVKSEKEEKGKKRQSIILKINMKTNGIKIFDSKLISKSRDPDAEKPFKCMICKKCFTQKGNVKNHLLVNILNELKVFSTLDIIFFSYNRYTQVRRIFNVIYVKSVFVKVAILNLTCRYTQTRNLLAVMCVIRHFVRLGIYVAICKYTRVSNHINVINVTKVLDKVGISSNTCTYIQVKNLINALSVTGDSDRLVILKVMLDEHKYK